MLANNVHNGLLTTSSMGSDMIEGIQSWAKGWVAEKGTSWPIYNADYPNLITGFSTCPDTFYTSIYEFQVGSSSYTFSTSAKTKNQINELLQTYPYMVLFPVGKQQTLTCVASDKPLNVILSSVGSECKIVSSETGTYNFINAECHYSDGFGKTLPSVHTQEVTADSGLSFKLSSSSLAYQRLYLTNDVLVNGAANNAVTPISGSPGTLAQDVIDGDATAGQAIDAAPTVNVEPTAIDNYGDVVSTLSGGFTDVLSGVNGIASTLSGIGADVISGMGTLANSLAGVLSGVLALPAELWSYLAGVLSAICTSITDALGFNGHTFNGDDVKTHLDSLLAYTPLYLIVYMRDFLTQIFGGAL